MARSGDPRRRNPRRPGGSIAGPGGPHDRGGVVIDMTDAVLLDATTVALVDPVRGGEPSGTEEFAVQLSGRINKTTERTEILYLMDEDGVAAIVTELMAAGTRHSPELAERLMGKVQERMAALEADGGLGRGSS